MSKKQGRRKWERGKKNNKIEENGSQRGDDHQQGKEEPQRIQREKQHKKKRNRYIEIRRGNDDLNRGMNRNRRKRQESRREATC